MHFPRSGVSDENISLKGEYAMPRIKIAPEQVRQSASQFKQASQQSQEIVNRLQNSINSLAPEWEGMSKERFFQQFEQWKGSMTQFVQLLNQIGTEMDAIAARLATADGQGQ